MEKTIKNIYKIIYLVLFIAIIYFAQSIFISYIFNTKEVTVPNVVNTDIEVAKKILKSRRLKYTIINGVSNVFEKNAVISQYPEENSTVKINRNIQLVVNSDNPSVVPDVIGLQLLSAKKLLKNSKINIGRIDYYPYEGDKDIVLATYPDINSPIDYNKEVTLLVSTSAVNSNVIMPNLIGLTYEQATTVLENINQRIKDISYVEDKTKEANTIIVTEPIAGDKIPQDGYISIVLNKIKKEDYNKDIDTIIKESLESLKNKEEKGENKKENNEIPSDKKN